MIQAFAPSKWGISKTFFEWMKFYSKNSGSKCGYDPNLEPKGPRFDLDAVYSFVKIINLKRRNQAKGRGLAKVTD